MEEEHDRKWTKDQNVHTQNEGRECKAQGEDKVNEITRWRIEVDEDN